MSDRNDDDPQSAPELFTIMEVMWGFTAVRDALLGILPHPVQDAEQDVAWLRHHAPDLAATLSHDGILAFMAGYRWRLQRGFDACGQAVSDWRVRHCRQQPEAPATMTPEQAQAMSDLIAAEKAEGRTAFGTSGGEG